MVRRSQRNIEWIEGYLKVPEGKNVGQSVVLRDWQVEIIEAIYDSPTRRAIISFGRKNGKTSLSAFLCLLHLVGPEARPNSQLYSDAQSRAQAAILFDLMAKMVRMNSDLSEYVGVTQSQKILHCDQLGTIYRALAAEAPTAYGLSPVFVVHDELGQVVGPRSQLYEALETAQGAHDDPLSVIISTQAPTDADLLSILIDDAKAGHDPRTKLFLYTADEDLDAFEEETIKKANPAYGDFLNPLEVLAQAKDASRMPSREADYRNLILNQRVNRNNPFVTAGVWKENAGQPDPNMSHVMIGLDLSARSDLTALIMRDGESVVAEFYAPANGVAERAKQDRVPYDLWADQGHITLTSGSTVDYEYVAIRLAEIDREYGIDVVFYDRWRIEELKLWLDKIGAQIRMEPFGQGYKEMAPALDALEADLLNKRIRHGGNPVLTWMASNAVVEMDAAGNRKLTKAKSTGRIDGMVALAMTSQNAEPEEFVHGGLVVL